MKSFKIVFAIFTILFFITIIGCNQVVSSNELNQDIELLIKQVKEIDREVGNYGGLSYSLILVRRNIVQNTLEALKQKASGYKRFIPVSYTINFETYQITNKPEQLKMLSAGIVKMKKQIKLAEKESKLYRVGLDKNLALNRKMIAKNTLAFLEQKKMLLQHDIPIVVVMPDLRQFAQGLSKVSFKNSLGTGQGNH